MKPENQISQLRKGVLELCILSIVAKGDVYASDILAQLKSSELIVVEGTLYPLLTRLKNDGYTQYRWEESRSGPPRKYYRITDAGIGFLENLKTDWSQLVASVESIIQLKPEKV